jgi:hypothetical protein
MNTRVILQKAKIEAKINGWKKTPRSYCLTQGIKDYAAKNASIGWKDGLPVKCEIADDMTISITQFSEIAPSTLIVIKAYHMKTPSV